MSVGSLWAPGDHQMCKLRSASVIGALVLSVTAARTQAQTPRAPVCYALQVGPWQPAFGDTVFHRLPATIRLDTLMWPDGGARHLEPDLDYPGRHGFPRTPRWEASADTIRLMWSNGFAPTLVTLVRHGEMLIGDAVAESDARPFGEPPRPRATVTARPIACRADRSQRSTSQRSRLGRY